MIGFSCFLGFCVAPENAIVAVADADGVSHGAFAIVYAS